MSGKAAKYVKQYIQLRDMINQMEDAHKEKMKPYRECLEMLGTALLNHLQTTNQESAVFADGTVYRSTKKAAPIADRSAFTAFVVKHQRYDLLDIKANPTAVEDWINENGTSPPGVNFNQVLTIGVRRK